MRFFSRVFLSVLAGAMIMWGIMSVILKIENNSFLSFASIYSLILSMVVLAYSLRERFKNMVTLITLCLFSALAIVCPVIICIGLVTPRWSETMGMLTLGWSDGFSFAPLDFVMLSSAKLSNLLCEMTSQLSKRSHGYKRRMESFSRKPECGCRLA